MVQCSASLTPTLGHGTTRAKVCSLGGACSIDRLLVWDSVANGSCSGDIKPHIMTIGDVVPGFKAARASERACTFTLGLLHVRSTLEAYVAG